MSVCVCDRETLRVTDYDRERETHCKNERLQERERERERETLREFQRF